MKKTFLILIFIFLSFCFLAAQENFEYIVLVHGLCRTSKSMNYLNKKLKAENYKVINFDYNSKKMTVEEISDLLKFEIEKFCTDKTKKINFITHSMGGIVVRYYLVKYKPNNIARIVMLSPPNHGSEIVDRAENSIFLKWIFEKYNGVNFTKLGKNENFLKKLEDMEKLQNNKYEIGIITGDRSWNPLFSFWINGRDDGKVSVESAKLDNIKNFLVVDASHTFIMNRKIVFEQIIYFFDNGVFKK
jgi:triacylglycerol lipase